MRRGVSLPRCGDDLPFEFPNVPLPDADGQVPRRDDVVAVVHDDDGDECDGIGPQAVPIEMEGAPGIVHVATLRAFAEPAGLQFLRRDIEQRIAPAVVTTPTEPVGQRNAEVTAQPPPGYEGEPVRQMHPDAVVRRPHGELEPAIRRQTEEVPLRLTGVRSEHAQPTVVMLQPQLKRPLPERSSLPHPGDGQNHAQETLGGSSIHQLTALPFYPLEPLRRQREARGFSLGGRSAGGP